MQYLTNIIKSHQISKVELCNRARSMSPDAVDLCSACLVNDTFLSQAECSQLWEVDRRDTVIELLRKESGHSCFYDWW